MPRQQTLTGEPVRDDSSKKGPTHGHGRTLVEMTVEEFDEHLEKLERGERGGDA